MKIVFPCARDKHNTYLTHQGTKIFFVAHPKKCADSTQICAHPDGKLPHSEQTGRGKIIELNESTSNRCELLKAAELYKNPTYLKLARWVGWEDFYILSAGWGLIRSDYRIPYYDITWSKKADSCYRRRDKDQFGDFNHLVSLRSIVDEIIYFPGLVSYIDFFIELTKNIPARKIIYHVTESITYHPGFTFKRYKTTQKTNWHYAWAKDLMDGNINFE